MATQENMFWQRKNLWKKNRQFQTRSLSLVEYKYFTMFSPLSKFRFGQSWQHLSLLGRSRTKTNKRYMCMYIYLLQSFWGHRLISECQEEWWVLKPFWLLLLSLAVNYLPVWINIILLSSWAIHYVTKYFFKGSYKLSLQWFWTWGWVYIVKLKMDPGAIIWVILMVFINYLGSSCFDRREFAILNFFLGVKMLL